MLTIVEESWLGIARRGPRRGGGGCGAPAAPLADHVDLLVGLVGQLVCRSRLPLLGHEAARHGGARIGLSATASARNRRTEKKREKRKSGAPGERRYRRSRASSSVVRVTRAVADIYARRGGARAATSIDVGGGWLIAPHRTNLACQLGTILTKTVRTRATNRDITCYSQSTSGSRTELC